MEYCFLAQTLLEKFWAGWRWTSVDTPSSAITSPKMVVERDGVSMKSAPSHLLPQQLLQFGWWGDTSAFSSSETLPVSGFILTVEGPPSCRLPCNFCSRPAPLCQESRVSEKVKTIHSWLASARQSPCRWCQGGVPSLDRPVIVNSYFWSMKLSLWTSWMDVFPLQWFQHAIHQFRDFLQSLLATHVYTVLSSMLSLKLSMIWQGSLS